MASVNPVPLPGNGQGPLNNANTGDAASTADLRAEFERMSQQTPRDMEAERAFLEGKLEMIRRDPRMSEDEKTRAMAEIRKRNEATPRISG